MAIFLTGTSNGAQVIPVATNLFLVAGAARHVDFQEAIAGNVGGCITRLRIDGSRTEAR